jgi:hypothetical protein
MPDIPQPSSRMWEEGVKRECVVRKLVGEASQVARRGVMSHRTVVGVSGMYVQRSSEGQA